MDQDPLHKFDVDKWNDLKTEYKLDWPRGITGYYALDYIERWLKLGQDYGFQVLVPFGEAKNGMVVVIKDEKDFIEVLIECPQNDTSRLAEALRRTKLIDWKRDVVVLFPRKHILECVKSIAITINKKCDDIHPVKQYVLDKKTPLYNVSLPQGFTFKQLSENYIDIVDSTWPHRYPGSTRYFQLLIRSKSGYGLFKEDQLIAFGFIKEMGALGHLYTLEEHRRKGYGEMVTMLICNEILKNGRDVYSFCVGNNINSCKMHEKLGFSQLDDVFSVTLKCLP